MAIFKPKTTESVNYYGVCDIAVLGFSDFSSKYDWADIYLDVEIKQKGSDYTKSIRIAGSFEKEPDGSIKGGSVLSRLYHFFDIVGIQAGVNAQGGWETEDGKAIENIADYLNANHALDNREPKTFPYLAYVYKEKPKKAGDKVYTRVHHKIQPNSPEGRTKLEADMDWLKKKGYLKEAKENEANNVSTQELEDVFGSDAMSNM
tara:strand:+ start:278 stop:889 length:612 start_codon:yes stop_codon:yes gene_type:complete